MQDMYIRKNRGILKLRNTAYVGHFLETELFVDEYVCVYVLITCYQFYEQDFEPRDGLDSNVKLKRNLNKHSMAF